jgi:hypothetical protein
VYSPGAAHCADKRMRCRGTKYAVHRCKFFELIDCAEHEPCAHHDPSTDPTSGSHQPCFFKLVVAPPSEVTVKSVGTSHTSR